jgi:5-methylcytosine-specific restriction endonuclease McrA
MLIRPSIAGNRTACSRSCANNIRTRAAGRQHRVKLIVCAGCHAQVVRTVKTDRDAGRYCGRQCAFDSLAHVAAERAALRRIGEALRQKLRAVSAAKVEVSQLRRIARNVKVRVKKCRACGAAHIRRAPGIHTCSRACEAVRLTARAALKALHRKSEAGMAARRRAKSKRRAAMRGVARESIDPIKVFARDKWRCHLCGVTTPRKLRGTTDDRAPELEHIVSLADGGSHTWGNVACSCRRCNISKGAASFGQLGLGFAA